MVKKRRARIILAMLLTLVMLMPECCSVLAEVVTVEGYAFVSFDNPKETNKMKIYEATTTQITQTIAGKKGRVMSATDTTSQMIYCDVDDGFLSNIPVDTPVAITIEYYDSAGGGSIGVAYDSYNPDLHYYSTNDIYNDAPPLYLEGTETWREHTWILGDMRLSNRCNAAADFRLCSWDTYMGTSATDVIVSSVKVYIGEFENPSDIFVGSEYIGNVFSEKDENITLDINVKNKEYDDIKGEYTVRVKDKLAGHDVYSETFELETAARSTNSQKVTFPNPGRYTIYTVDVDEKAWKIKSPDSIKTQTFGSECSVSMMVEPGEGNPMMGSMAQVIKDGRGHPDKVYKHMARMGATWNREDVGWSLIEQQKGVLKLPDGMLETYKEMKDAGIQLMFVCLGRNPHYDNFNTPASDEAIAGFANYCAFMAKELEGVCDYFEIWNEWNISTFNPSREPPETYAKLCKAAYTAIKKVRPDAIVMGVGTALIDLPWTKRVFDAGAYDYMDMVTIHPYDFNATFREQKFINDGIDLVNLMKQYGEVKPICYSELGFSTLDGPVPANPGYPGYSQTEQASAKILSNAVLRANDLADLLIEYCFFDLNDQTYIEACWGLVYKWDVNDVDYKPAYGAKESYLQTAAMNKIWGANTDFREQITKERAYAFNFYNNKDNRNVLVLVSGEGEQTMNIDLGTKSVDLYDMYGNKMSTLHSDNGVYAFGISKIAYYAIGNFERFEESTQPGAIVPDSITQIGTANDILKFKLTKNIDADLTVEVGAIDGATVAENKGFIGDTAEIVIHSDKSAIGEKVVPITVKDASGRIYYYAEHRLQLKDPVTITIGAQRVTEANNNHWAAKVTVHNNSQAGTHTGTVNMTAPEELVPTTRERSFVNLSPGKDAVFLYNLPTRISKQPVDVSFNVVLDGGLEYSESEQLLFTTAKYAEKKPTIDGVLTDGEWPANWIGVDEERFVKLIENWGGPDDLSFNANLMWDEEAFYMLVVVRDNIHSVMYTPNEISYQWKGDGIQFAVDDRVVVPSAQEGDYTELGFAQLPSGESALYRWTSLYDGAEDNVIAEKAETAFRHEDGVSVYECRIPWSEIFYEGYVVNPDEPFRFSALVNDNDGAGRRGYIEYSTGIGLSKNASLHGRMILER